MASGVMMVTIITAATIIGAAMVEAMKVAMESGEDRLAIVKRNIITTQLIW